MYVSITGLKLHGLWHAPQFLWHVMRSLPEARKTPGNRSAVTRSVDGWQHTLTVWDDRAAMRRFLASAAHRQAVGVSGRIGTTRTCSYEADHAPDWDEALAHWREHGRDH